MPQENTTPESAGGAQLEPPAVPVVSNTTPNDDEPLGEAGVKALKAERDRAKRLEAELKTLRDAEQQRADAEKSELQRAQEAAVKLQAELTAANRGRFAAEKGIPEGLLSGATPDEWQASADALIAFRGTAQPVPQPAPTATGVQGATGSPVTAAGDLKAQIQAAQAAGDWQRVISLTNTQLAIGDARKD